MPFKGPINTSLTGFQLTPQRSVPTFNSPPPVPTINPCPVNVTQTGPHLNVGATIPNIVNSGPHNVSANAYGKIPLTTGVPPGAGGGVQYINNHGHGAGLNVDHISKVGTTVDVGANVRLMQSQDGSAQLNATAGAARHFGRHGQSSIQRHGGLSFTKQL